MMGLLKSHTRQAQPESRTLTARDAALIKRMLQRGDRQHDIADLFGVNGGRIAEIASGKTFADVVVEPDSLLRSETIRAEMDLADPPPLDATERAELEALKNQPDGAIEYSDIPELADKFWESAVLNPYYRPIKQQITLRLDAGIVAWFKRHAEGGRGYQTEINRVLRDYVKRKND